MINRKNIQEDNSTNQLNLLTSYLKSFHSPTLISLLPKEKLFKINENQNVESFFQKFTLDREIEVNNLLEEKKNITAQVKQEKNPKHFYEECLNHFTRNNDISAPNSFTYKSAVKPTSTNGNKNTINPQPQVNYNQTSTNQPTSSSSTNKNFPHKTFNQQHTQGSDSYFPQQPMMNMYPFFYSQPTGESNMTNPQFFPQMMPPQMMYMMNQFVRNIYKISISNKCTIRCKCRTLTT